MAKTEEAFFTQSALKKPPNTDGQETRPSARLAYTPYQQHFRDTLAATWRFFEAHKHPRTADDWQVIADATSGFGDTLTLEAKFVLVAVEELEREYKEATR
jgi:hypothetical protein